ncbi:YeeE/YedE family protein [Ferviditalea candida]|uniref:YeeE/YedE family protein n=1 Tax=Ferviditalea candida TaxID=3108399 RepID=A0ABU5ZJG6_9BACL|nr:YeeE/YedE family protein [Paenibacillaceae bacterium T2]
MAYTWDIFVMAAVFGFLYGFLLQKADFCFVASIRDLISVRDTRILNGVLVLIAAALLGWGIALAAGAAEVSQIWTVPLGGANLLGGILFGIGMTLSGGCGSGTLYRCGMGYVQFWIVLICAIAGNLLFAFLYDPWVRDYFLQPLTLDGDGYTLFSLPLSPLVIPVLIVAVMLIAAVRRHGAKAIMNGFREALTDWKRNPLKQAHWDIRLVAALLGIIASIQFVMMSNVSITGPETRIGGVLLALIFGEGIVYNNTYLNGLFADFPRIGIGPEETLVMFMVVGAFCSAVMSGSFKLRLPRAARLPYAVGGGLLMGVASRLAPGCNIANLIAGVGGLSMSSVIVIVGMIIGIFIVTAYIFRMPLLLFSRED